MQNSGDGGVHFDIEVLPLLRDVIFQWFIVMEGAERSSILLHKVLAVKAEEMKYNMFNYYTVLKYVHVNVVIGIETHQIKAVLCKINTAGRNTLKVYERT